MAVHSAGLELRAWCLPWGESKLETDHRDPLSGTVQAFAHPVPSLAVTSQEKALWRQGQRLVCAHRDGGHTVWGGG